MTARYSDLQVRISPSEHLISVRIRVHNTGEKVWSSDQGDGFSYRVLDAVSGNLIFDGPRQAYPVPVQPQGNANVELSCDLPPEPGNYRIYVSPVCGKVNWLYDQGAPFLLLDAEVAGNDLRLHRSTITTVRRERLERLLQAVGRAFTYPVQTMIEYRSLIRSMVRREIVGRYRGSYGGLFWTVFHPLLMMLTYYFVFGIVLQTRFANDDRPSTFVLYFLAGMLPWLAFSEAVARAPTTVFEHSNFVRKLVFPVETLPVNLVFAGLFSEAFGIVIFLAAMLFFGYPLPVETFFLPLILIPQFLFTLGVCWFLAALGVFFRDLGQVIGFVLTVWFFTTPICYPEVSLPQNYLWLFEKNPMYVLVHSYRSIFLEAASPPWESLTALTAASVVIFVLGHACFYKLKRSFADLV